MSQLLAHVHNYGTRLIAQTTGGTMPLTIEWLHERASSGVIRMDLDRGSLHKGFERVSAEVLGFFQDEEGEQLGLVRYNGHSVAYTHTGQRDQYTTFIGEVMGDWTADWRVEADRMVRFGYLHRSGPSWGEGTETRKTIWARKSLENITVLQYLCRLEGAIGQAARYVDGDACSLLHKLAGQLNTLVSTNSESALAPFVIL